LPSCSLFLKSIHWFSRGFCLGISDRNISCFISSTPYYVLFITLSPIIQQSVLHCVISSSYTDVMFHKYYSLDLEVPFVSGSVFKLALLGSDRAFKRWGLMENFKGK
jgi:hypothetical protein